jgi:hypothetical protein
MATIPKFALGIAKTYHDGPPNVFHAPEAASQTFLLGELVYLVAGKVTECGANPNEILGVALTAASGTTDTDIAVGLATADTVFVGNINGTGVTAVAQVGARLGVTLASNKWHVDSTKTGTTARVIVVGLDTRDAVGDTAGRVHFVVLGNHRQFDLTS